MNDMEYKLSVPVKGVEVLYFTAPTYQHQDFTSLVETIVSRESFRMAKEMRDGKTKEEILEAEKKAKEEVQSQEDTLEQKQEYIKLVLKSSGTVKDIAQAFVKMCSSSDICKANGGPIPKDIWNSMLDKDVKGAMYKYIANFIE